MNELQLHNLREIEGLNQRGGRTLSLVDLIRAGTMSPEMVAHAWTAIAHGASFLTAARPGGAGKSTVLANLLALLPADQKIVTWEPELVIPPLVSHCYLAHEIGAGNWYGYIWDSCVGRFLGLHQEEQRVASCLHADTIEELRDILLTPPLNVRAEYVEGIHLILFVHVKHGSQRRVAALYEATEEGARLAFALDEHDQLVRQGPSQLFPRLGTDEAEYERRLQTVWRIVGEGDERFEVVREKLLENY